MTFSSYPFPFLALLFPFSLQSAHIPILLLHILPPFPSSSFFTYLPFSIVFILCQPSFSCPYFLDFPSFLPYSTQPGLAYLSGSFSFPYQVLLHQYLGLFYLFSLITQIPNFIDSRAYLGPLQLSHHFLGYPSFWPSPPTVSLSDLSSITPILPSLPLFSSIALSTSFCYHSLCLSLSFSTLIRVLPSNLTVSLNSLGRYSEYYSQ